MMTLFSERKARIYAQLQERAKQEDFPYISVTFGDGIDGSEKSDEQLVEELMDSILRSLEAFKNGETVPYVDPVDHPPVNTL